MKVNVRYAFGSVLLLVAATAAPLAMADHWLPNCPHPARHAHSYDLGWPAWKSRTATWHSTQVSPFSGGATVWEGNLLDCDGDFMLADPSTELADFDGDHETGVGGGFFGYGPWAHEPVCDHGLTSHSNAVTVTDFAHGNNVPFVIGADQTAGPALAVDPVDGSVSCITDGNIEPCSGTNPSPTCGPSDCLTQTFIGTGTTCGAGGDGGYWVFLLYGHVSARPGGVLVGNPPTAGTIAA